MPKGAPVNTGASSELPIGPRQRVSEMQAKLHRCAGADPVAVTYTGDDTPLVWCCGEGMMIMPVENCPCHTSPQPCACCAGTM